MDTLELAEEEEELMLVADSTSQANSKLSVRKLVFGTVAIAGVLCTAVFANKFSRKHELPVLAEDLHHWEQLIDSGVQMSPELKAQCEAVYKLCFPTPGYTEPAPPGCKDKIADLLSGFTPFPSGRQINTFHDRLLTDGGCSTVPKCVADHGSWVGAEPSGMQQGAVARESEICPMSMPTCVGYLGASHTFGNCQALVNKATSAWPTGETLSCKNTPGWTNSYKDCKEDMETFNPSTCVPGSGWTCAGYLKNRFCVNGGPADWGEDTPVGPTMNNPEVNCCGCKGGASAVQTVATAQPTVAALPPQYATAAPTAAAAPGVAAPAAAGVAPAAPAAVPGVVPGAVPGAIAPVVSTTPQTLEGALESAANDIFQ